MAHIQRYDDVAREWCEVGEPSQDEAEVLREFRALDARKPPLQSLRFIGNDGRQRLSPGGPRVPVGYEVAATSTGW
jgi:hypothetical protein